MPITINVCYFLLAALRNNAVLFQFANNSLSIHIIKELHMKQV